PNVPRPGGGGFWLVREPSGRVRALMAAGRTGANARRELYRDYETIPPRGALAALTVPGAVAGWMLALEAASACGGRPRLGELLPPPASHSGGGPVLDRRQAPLPTAQLAPPQEGPPPPPPAPPPPPPPPPRPH